MKILKLIFFTIATSCLALSLNNQSISIGQAWKTYHVNSLIGFQKIFESTFNIWFKIILPILEIKIILLFGIINLIIFLLLIRKK
jgi:hypothetical protein